MKWIPILFLLHLCLSACVQPAIEQPSNIECEHPKTVLPSVETPSNFKQAIAEAENRTLNGGDQAAMAYLDLSVLYSHHANPEPDYARAQSSLEQYVELSGQDQPSITLTRLALLRKLNELLSANKKDSDLIELMRQDNRTLMLEIQDLKNSIEALQNENMSMKQMMESLNQIEIQHEQKRMQIQ
jgi:hypothetical protein